MVRCHVAERGRVRSSPPLRKTCRFHPAARLGGVSVGMCMQVPYPDGDVAPAVFAQKQVARGLEKAEEAADS